MSRLPPKVKQHPTKAQRAWQINPSKQADPVADQGSWWLDLNRAEFADVTRTRVFPYSKTIYRVAEWEA